MWPAVPAGMRTWTLVLFPPDEWRWGDIRHFSGLNILKKSLGIVHHYQLQVDSNDQRPLRFSRVRSCPFLPGQAEGS